jgi:hypothetical protein
MPETETLAMAYADMWQTIRTVTAEIKGACVQQYHVCDERTSVVRRLTIRTTDWLQVTLVFMIA